MRSTNQKMGFRLDQAGGRSANHPMSALHVVQLGRRSSNSNASRSCQPGQLMPAPRIQMRMQANHPSFLHTHTTTSTHHPLDHMSVKERKAEMKKLLKSATKQERIAWRSLKAARRAGEDTSDATADLELALQERSYAETELAEFRRNVHVLQAPDDESAGYKVYRKLRQTALDLAGKADLSDRRAKYGISFTKHC